MIDRDEMRIARRTVERNGYTVLPPRRDDERELNRYRLRQRERETLRNRREDDINDRQSRFKPLRYHDDERPIRRVSDEGNDRPSFRRERPIDRTISNDEDRRPLRRLSPEDELAVAKATAERNGFEVRKLTKLDQAKQVAKDAGFEVKKVQPRQAPIRNTNADDEGVKLRTTPDVELNRNQQIEDDYVARAAKFFGEDDE